MASGNIVIKPNPLSSGTPVAADLAAITGVDQGTVAAKLDAEIRQEQDRRMMDPAAYSNVNDPYDVALTAAENTKVELMNPELNVDKDKSTTSEQADGANEFSADDLNDWETATDWANSLYPDDDDISVSSIANDEQITPGSVNGDSDLTNQSLDFMNSIEPTPEAPGPEVDVVPNDAGAGGEGGDVGGTGGDVGGVVDENEDPSEVAGDGI